ncbi:hypothetical protein DL93DRAFT_489490 [Clavulina sp. PMI_390]|nr:hypothetical protein DL93DRAFT_489490 [Clavulina sp. PMI_390]
MRFGVGRRKEGEWPVRRGSIVLLHPKGGLPTGGFRGAARRSNAKGALHPCVESGREVIVIVVVDLGSSLARSLFVPYPLPHCGGGGLVSVFIVYLFLVFFGWASDCILLCLPMSTFSVGSPIGQSSLQTLPQSSQSTVTDEFFDGENLVHFGFGCASFLIVSGSGAGRRFGRLVESGLLGRAVIAVMNRSRVRSFIVFIVTGSAILCTPNGKEEQ